MKQTRRWPGKAEEPDLYTSQQVKELLGCQVQLPCQASSSYCPGPHSLLPFSTSRCGGTFTLCKELVSERAGTGSEELWWWRQGFPISPLQSTLPQTIPTVEESPSANRVLFSKAECSDHQEKNSQRERQGASPGQARVSAFWSYLERLSLPQCSMIFRTGDTIHRKALAPRAIEETLKSTPERKPACPKLSFPCFNNSARGRPAGVP